MGRRRLSGVLASGCLIAAACSFDLDSVRRPAGDATLDGRGGDGGGGDGGACSIATCTGTCRDGQCCHGCWDGTKCEPGNTAGACGTGGAACIVCDDHNPCTQDGCSSGACTATPVSRPHA